MKSRSATDEFKAVGVSEIDFNIAYSEELVPDFHWPRTRTSLLADSNTWRLAGENRKVNTRTCAKRTLKNISGGEERLCDELGSGNVKPVELSSAYSEKTLKLSSDSECDGMEATVELNRKKVVDPKTRQNNIKLDKVGSDDKVPNNKNEECSAVEIEEIKYIVEIVDISSDSDNEEEREAPKRKRVVGPITLQNNILFKGIPTRPKGKRLADGITQQNLSILDQKTPAWPKGKIVAGSITWQNKSILDKIHTWPNGKRVANSITWNYESIYNEVFMRPKGKPVTEPVTLQKNMISVTTTVKYPDQEKSHLDGFSRVGGAECNGVDSNVAFSERIVKGPNDTKSEERGDARGDIRQFQRTQSTVPNCRHGCFHIVAPKMFEKLNAYFCSLKESEQDAYLSSLMVPKPVATWESKKNRSFVYMLKHEARESVVCQKAFMHAFSVSYRRLENLQQKQEEEVQLINDHLKNFPMVASHSSVCNTSPPPVYLAPDLKLDRLYALYVQFIVQRPLPYKVVTKDCYQRILERYSNVWLRSTKTLQCHVCEGLNRAIQNVTVLPDQDGGVKEARVELRKHEALAREDQEIIGSIRKRRDTENTLILYVGIRQAQPIPKTPEDLNYYKRKLWTYNLGVCDLRRQGMMKVYVWDEVTAKRGSIEVISGLSKWIEDNHDREDNLVLFTDSIGRYRNLNMLLFLLRLIHNKKFLRIDHYFLVPGHHANPCNRIFADIESALEVQSTIMSMVDIVRYIREGVSVWDIDVVEMERKDFLDYSVLQPHVQGNILDEMTFENARVISLHCCYKEGYYVTLDYNMTSKPRPVRLMPGDKPFSPKTFNLGRVEIPPKYSSPILLDPQKLRDLKDLLHCIVPYEKRDYLRGIFVDQETLEDAAIVKEPIKKEEEEDDDFFDYV